MKLRKNATRKEREESLESAWAWDQLDFFYDTLNDLLDDGRTVGYPTDIHKEMGDVFEALGSARDAVVVAENKMAALHPKP